MNVDSSNAHCGSRNENFPSWDLLRVVNKTKLVLLSARTWARICNVFATFAVEARNSGGVPFL